MQLIIKQWLLDALSFCIDIKKIVLDYSKTIYCDCSSRFYLRLQYLKDTITRMLFKKQLIWIFL